MRKEIIIAGAEKCGTTALHFFLSQHPQVIGSNPKELNFFNSDLNYNKGKEYYHSFFQKKYSFLKKNYFLEASPSYTEVWRKNERMKKTAERIYNYNKHAKIIILVRNPIYRAFSAWKMYQERFQKGNKDWWLTWFSINGITDLPPIIKRKDDEFSNFELYVKHEIEEMGNIIQLPVLLNGNYNIGISIFQDVFQENLIVVKNEDLNKNTSSTLERISDFLGMKKNNWEKFNTQKIFAGNYNDRPNKAAINMLENYYRDSDMHLKKLTGISYIP